MKNYNVNVELENILLLLKMDAVVNEVIRKYVEKTQEIEELVAKAYEGEIPDFNIAKRKPHVRLAIVCYKLINLQKEYVLKGIEGSVFQSTIDDITLRQNIYWRKTGKVGLSRDDVIWFRHIFAMKIFKLGELQFQIFDMLYLDEETIGEEYMMFSKEQKLRLPSKTPVINVHIQKKANLEPNKIDESFQLAQQFFENYFPEHKYKGFLCYSWLMYPENKKLLSTDSKILKFASRFTIISQIQDTEEAIERIFGKRYRAKDNYPQITSLQREALFNLKLLGYACGIIYI